MITKNLLWGSLTLVLMVSGAAGQNATGGADEKAVTANELQWLKSQQTNNTELEAPLLADKVIETTEDNKVIVGKEAVLADAKGSTWTSADYSDLKVTLFEHTAIATGTFAGKGKDSAGKPIDSKGRFTDTWVKMANGKWLCVATHYSRS
jgi:ketosteroid isomerase-like protein